jgi:antitoxin (DNA-binding transcriptional repressor) of toxin-antitoxin stability system
MVVRTEIGTGRLAELVRQVQAGNEVLFVQGDKPVARLVPASESKPQDNSPLVIRSLKGHKVLTPNISQAEIAEEMFRRK